jgi:importin-9
MELLAALVENGCEPLPSGFVATLFPTVARVLMESDETDVLRPGANAVKWMLVHDHSQVLGYQEASGRSGLDVCLHITSRLLDGSAEEDVAATFGGLVAELVQRVDWNMLGSFLPELLEAMASRLATAQSMPLIQSLTLIFARLFMVETHDVVESLSQMYIYGESGLRIVMTLWLENAVYLAGYDEIYQKYARAPAFC